MATQLQYLGPGCLTVARVCFSVGGEYNVQLAQAVSSIVEVFRLLADDPASAAVRSRAAHQLTALASRLANTVADTDYRNDAARVAVSVIDLLVVDTLVFCGVGPP